MTVTVIVTVTKPSTTTMVGAIQQHLSEISSKFVSLIDDDPSANILYSRDDKFQSLTRFTKQKVRIKENE